MKVKVLNSEKSGNILPTPVEYVHDTNGLHNEKAIGTDRTENSIQKNNKQLSEKRKKEKIRVFVWISFLTIIPDMYNAAEAWEINNLCAIFSK